ncbi:1-phosphofructokinase [Caryophanon tenue]|uniref:Tagatose-6-phosphate kinase n=1 Tax=Caryophanon tenue TaxID=33978 RepID=A0A1C0YD16_9BACL|nr:1-phosphofructokinase [Caryophanon tenue]OCS85068.1 1-phosphofructokinase [Caryophanon tenue]
MIYTCTFSPAIDYMAYVDTFSVGTLNRAHDVHYLPGGKGINVSRVLQACGQPSTALGFIGGFTGQYLQQLLHDQHIETAFIETDEITRINVKVKATLETELNGPSPIVHPHMLEALCAQLATLQEGDWFILSGTVPEGVAIETLLTTVAATKAHIVADTSGQLLHRVLPYKPVFVKPNIHELAELFQARIHTADEAIPYAKRLLEKGAQHVIVSLGADGALFVAADEVYHASAPTGEVINSVGAGDSVVAATIAHYLKTRNWQQAFAFGVAAGSATAFQVDLCTYEDIQALQPFVQLTKR